MACETIGGSAAVTIYMTQAAVGIKVCPCEGKIRGIMIESTFRGSVRVAFQAGGACILITSYADMLVPGLILFMTGQAGENAPIRRQSAPHWLRVSGLSCRTKTC